MRSSAAKLAAAGATAAAGAAVWGIGVERYLFTLRQHTAAVLKPGAQPIRLLHISDLHLAPWQRRKIEWVRSLADSAPDAIVFTGDLLGHREAIGALKEALEPLAASGAQLFFVHGSNDYYGPLFKSPLRYLRAPSRLATRVPDIDNAQLTRMLTGLGAIDLNNTAAVTSLRGSNIVWAGVNDPHIKYDNFDALAQSISDQVIPDDAVVFGVVHAPYQYALNRMLDLGAELILAGHTHGGQVRVPGVGALTSNCDLPHAQARGFDVWFNAHRAAYLNVSAGVGTSIYAPVRFACRPEATLLTLTAGGAG